ncbi:MAG: hypothetical protein HYX57_12820 [Chloroflexi bacterium]|nr:hypothetical protein [Chloroflexota bacterium]
MGKSASLAIPLGLLLSLGIAGTVIAHEGSGQEEIVVEPSTVTAGGTVVLAGTGLEPTSDRVLVLAGEGFTVDLGTVTTDAEGMFQIELTIPSHLPSGTYELRAIGDETLTATLDVTALAGGPDASPGPGGASDSVVPRDRSSLELAAIIGLVGAAALAGGLLVWRAEWLRGAFGG